MMATVGQRIRIRANGGVPVRRYALPDDMHVEVYQNYPGYAVVIEQHGRRWYACGFRTWGPSRYEQMGGEWRMEKIGDRVCKYKYTTGGELAADVYNHSGFGASLTADDVAIIHTPKSYPSTRSFDKLWKRITA